VQPGQDLVAPTGRDVEQVGLDDVVLAEGNALPARYQVRRPRAR
jgi:hypothetical protein